MVQTVERDEQKEENRKRAFGQSPHLFSGAGRVAEGTLVCVEAVQLDRFLRQNFPVILKKNKKKSTQYQQLGIYS